MIVILQIKRKTGKNIENENDRHLLVNAMLAERKSGHFLLCSLTLEETLQSSQQASYYSRIVTSDCENVAYLLLFRTLKDMSLKVRS